MFPPQTYTSPSRAHDADAAIRLTDVDAAVARLSAVKKGYLHDPFVNHFVPRAHLQPPRPPLINIGTYVRSAGIDRLVDEWLERAGHDGDERGRCQIVSLGAGSDSRFWRIATGSQRDRLATYIELDFLEVTTKKTLAISKSKALREILERDGEFKLSHGGTTLHSPVYHLLPVDLRHPPSETLPSILAQPFPNASSSAPLLSPSLPTLLLSECVLVYMPPEASAALIQWFVDYVGGEGVLGGIVYEMFGLQDAFGQVMVGNLQARNVTLPGAAPYPSISSLPDRFLKHGFTSAHALTLREIWKRYIDASELERISTLELLDEVEELNLVLEHYAITWGVRVSPGSASLSQHVGWQDWSLRPAPLVQEEE